MKISLKKFHNDSLKNALLLVADEDLAALYSGAFSIRLSFFYEGLAFRLCRSNAVWCSAQLPQIPFLPEAAGDAGIMLILWIRMGLWS